jgi:hypothetical protein
MRCQHCGGPLGLGARWYHPEYRWWRPSTWNKRLTFCGVQCEAWWWHDWKRYRGGLSLYRRSSR